MYLAIWLWNHVCMVLGNGLGLLKYKVENSYTSAKQENPFWNHVQQWWPLALERMDNPLQQQEFELVFWNYIFSRTESPRYWMGGLFGCINVMFSWVILCGWKRCRNLYKITQKFLLPSKTELIPIEMYFDIVPLIFMLVLLSVNAFVAMFTVSKSAPNMGLCTFAWINIQEKIWILKFTEWFPTVYINFCSICLLSCCWRNVNLCVN